MVDEHVELVRPCQVGRGDLLEPEVRGLERRRLVAQEHLGVAVQLLVDVVRVRQPLGQRDADQSLTELDRIRMDRPCDANVASGQISLNGHVRNAPFPSVHSPCIG